MSVTMRGLIAAAVLFAAAPAAAADDVDHQVTERVRVVYATPALDSAIEFYLRDGQAAAFRTRGQLGMLSIAVRNLSGSNLTLEYQVDWYDADGFPINAVSGWQTLLLTPNQERDVRSVAQEPGAQSARITVRAR